MSVGIFICFSQKIGSERERGTFLVQQDSVLFEFEAIKVYHRPERARREDSGGKKNLFHNIIIKED